MKEDKSGEDNAQQKPSEAPNEDFLQKGVIIGHATETQFKSHTANVSTLQSKNFTALKKTLPTLKTPNIRTYKEKPPLYQNKALTNSYKKNDLLLQSTSGQTNQISPNLNPNSTTNLNQPLQQINFIDFHSRNLNVLKKLSKRYNLLHPPAPRQETSMERFNKIKKFFNLDQTQTEEKTNRHNINLARKYPVLEYGEYTYSVMKGNNAEVVQNCFKHRLNWKEVPEGRQSEMNLIWVPTSNHINFNWLTNEKDSKKIIFANHFENHATISNKLNLFINLMKYCEAKGQDVFKFMPLTILMQYESDSYLKQFSQFEELFNHVTDFVGANESKENRVKYRDYFTLGTTEKIGFKTQLYIHKNHYNDKNLWLIKAINLNRGRCIKLSNSVEETEKIIKHFYQGIMKGFKESEKENEEIKNIIIPHRVVLPKIKKKKGSPPRIDYSVINLKINNTKKYQSSIVIVQKYIEKPLLYYERKFDMRIWVLLTHKMEVYVFKEGHLKATSVKFDIESKNSYVHLTNYSVQKYNENFSKFEYGNEISFYDFQNLFTNILKTSTSVRRDIFPKLKEIIKTTFLCIKDQINQNDRKFCFEIFGYDFMLDCDLNPFLIEVNTNPGLEISSPLISVLVPRMVDDALRLTVDEVFKTEYIWGKEGYFSPFHVPNYDDRENMWEKVCELN